jgi:flavin reductase (DIM6/NTAB) family NADH-FMN oxidoreductase RutF
MELTSTTFRKVMGHFATGVTVVTVLSEERPRGITVNALTSVSLEPPLVVIAIDRRRRITPFLRAAGRFAINVLGEDQQHLSDCFAGAAMEPGVEAFCGAAWHQGKTGLVLLDGAIATLECTTERTVSAGDHDMYIARVDALDTTERHDQPLLYYRRRYLRVERALELVPEGRQEQ